MFTNFKVIVHISSPIATIDNIILDSIISSAKAKEILKDEYYSNKNNPYGTREMIENTLNPILDKKYGVYCTSAGIGDNREFISTWSKRYDTTNDDLIKFEGKGKQRIDIGGGYFKNYHMPIVLKSYKTIDFYVRGDMQEVRRLLENYIFYLGKKSSQGYGEIREYEFIETEEDYSIIKDNKLMRPVPIRFVDELKLNKEYELQEHATIPPYWRSDEREVCFIP